MHAVCQFAVPLSLPACDERGEVGGSRRAPYPPAQFKGKAGGGAAAAAAALGFEPPPTAAAAAAAAGGVYFGENASADADATHARATFTTPRAPDAPTLIVLTVLYPLDGPLRPRRQRCGRAVEPCRHREGAVKRMMGVKGMARRVRWAFDLRGLE